MRLAGIPLPDERNPFAILLYRALDRRGVELAGEGFLNPRWLVRHRRSVDVLHLHWPEHLFLRPSAAGTLLRAARAWALLLLARLLGYRVWWTVHNARPHDAAREQVARVGLLPVAWLANDLFVHSESARHDVATLFGRRHRVHLAPHGNYVGWYEDGVARAEARRRAGVEDATGTTFLLLGRLSAYKGVRETLAAFAKAAGEQDRLVVAGLVKEPDLRADIAEAAAADPRIRFADALVPDDELQHFFGAADVALFPFRTMTTSGSLLLALGFGVPVIASRIGNAEEVVDASCGALVPPGDVDALAAAMRAIGGRDLAAMSEAARARAAAFDWDEAAAVMAATLPRLR